MHFEYTFDAVYNVPEVKKQIIDRESSHKNIQSPMTDLSKSIRTKLTNKQWLAKGLMFGKSLKQDEDPVTEPCITLLYTHSPLIHIYKQYLQI